MSKSTQSSRSGRFVLSSDVRFRMIADEAVVVRQEDAEVLVLNDVAARVLQLVDEGRGVGEMVDLLLEEFEVDRAQLAPDVDSILAELVEAGVLVAGSDEG